MPFGKLIKSARGLMEITRYQNMYRHKERSVAEHSWSVTFIAQGLAMWETRKFDNEVDFDILLKKAVNHDLIETFTGDIIATTKKKTKAMMDAVAEIEKVAFEQQLMPDLPKSWVDEYRSYILDPKGGDIEGKIIKAADTIDTMIEAIEEIELGNNAFKPVFEESLKMLMNSELDSVKYFLKYAMLDFELDENLYPAIVRVYIDQLEFDPTVFDK